LPVDIYKFFKYNEERKKDTTDCFASSSTYSDVKNRISFRKSNRFACTCGSNPDIWRYAYLA
jgi:hypothetical protein